MSIVAMKKLRLMGIMADREEILKRLMLLGCVEISAPDRDAAASLLSSASTVSRAETVALKAKRAVIVNALKTLDKHLPIKQGLFASKPEVALSDVLNENALTADLDCAERITELEKQLRSISAAESRERTVISSLEPWRGADVPLDYPGTEHVELSFGSLPASVGMELATDTLATVDEAELYEISADKTGRYVLLVTSRDKTADAMDSIKPLGFTQLKFAGLSGTAEQNIEQSNLRLDELSIEREEILKKLSHEAESRLALQTGADTLDTCIARAESAEKLLCTESTFYFEGWQTAPDEQKLNEALKDFCCCWETEQPDAEHPELVPVKLKNNPITKPFNLVTEMYSLPAYNGLDPNPFIMPFFSIFFGIMFADMAYGILLLVAGSLMLWKFKLKGGIRNIAGIMFICGISTFIFGFLTGGFFGDAVSVVGKMFGQDWHLVPHLASLSFGSVVIDLPLNLLEGNNPLYVLIGAVILGAVHLALGVAIGAYLKFKDGQWFDAIFNDLSWWVILAGIGFAVLGKGSIVLYVGLAMMVIGAFMSNKGFGRITGIFSAVYNGATGYLGDLLSYSRLMALMLAGSVIASVFNQLGALGGGTVGGVLLFIVVFCIGHVLNFGLNVIGCFVHTLRLQYLEFFGKWYRDGGRPFKPLSINTKYVDIKEEI